MDFIHAREYLHEGDVVVVTCSHQCNVLIMDDANFSCYRSGGAFRHWGGHFKRLPARIAVPHDGYWNTALDLGGGTASITYNIGYIRRS
jgi:Domain of unknown function (DUF1883)